MSKFRSNKVGVVAVLLLGAALLWGGYMVGKYLAKQDNAAASSAAIVAR